MRLSFKHIFVFVILFSSLVSITAQDSGHIFLYAMSQPENDEVEVYTHDVETKTSSHVGTLFNDWSDAGWSPAGQYVFLLHHNDGDYQSAELYHLDTEDMIRVSDELTNSPCNASMHWSPDDHFLEFNTKIEDTYSSQHILDLQTADIFALPDNPPLYNYYPDWSPNSRYLLQYIPTEKYVINMILWDMANREIVVQIKTHQTGVIAWSPDSRYFTYTSDQNQEEVTIFDTQTLTSQTFNSKEMGKWSPDSRYLSYRHEDTLFLLDVENQITQEVVIHPNLVYLTDWSFDSQYLAFIVGDEQIGGIYVYEPATGTNKRLTDNLPFINNLIWSPNTHDLVFTQLLQDAYDNGRSNLNVYNLDDETRITHEISIPMIYFDRPLHWSPTGEHLAVWTNSGIQVLTIGDGTFEHVNASVPYTSSPRWSSDGQFLAYDTESDVYILDISTGQTLTLDDDHLIRFIGWRGTNKNTSLIHCGIG